MLTQEIKKYKNAYWLEVKSLRKYLIPILLVLLLSYIFYNVADGKMVIALGKEDSFFEWLTALFYFISFLMLMLTFRKNRNIFLLLLGFVLFFGAGEEFSWGQRIFGFATPEKLNEINVQHEFNIHNLKLFDGKYMNREPKQGLDRLLEMDLLFKIFNLFFGIALPFCVYHFKFISNLCKKLKVPVPPISLGIFFAFSWIGLKFSLSRIPYEATLDHFDATIDHFGRIYMAGPEIAEFISSFILAMICLYFYNNRNENIMGKDFKQLGNL